MFGIYKNGAQVDLITGKPNTMMLTFRNRNNEGITVIGVGFEKASISSFQLWTYES
jgi:hypothetical protein